MFGFGWVRTHLGDVFFGEYTSFLLILVGFMEKWMKLANMGKFWGPTSRCRDPTQQRRSTLRRGMSTLRCGRDGGLDKPRVRRGVAKLHCGEGLCRSLRCGVVLFTDMCFCHVFLFCYYEDLLIGLMRTL